MRRWQKVVAGVVGTSALLFGAAYGYHRYRMARMMRLVDELPVFSEPAHGAKAPTARAFGFTVGSSSLRDVKAALLTEKLDCHDSSIRALMDLARTQKRQEIEAAKASGAGVDSVSGASMIYRRSPKERNPQVRLSCAQIAASNLHDHARAQSTGRLLLVFDSPKHPLRHASYARSFNGAEELLAASEFKAALDAMTSSFGPATVEVPETVQTPLPLYKSYMSTWTFTDLKASVRLMNMGDGRLSLDETIEVPWPVRSDAPTLLVAPAPPQTAATL